MISLKDTMGQSLFETLHDRFGVSETEFREALERRSETGGSFIETLVQKNRVSETELLETLGMLYDVPFLSELPLDGIDPTFTQQVPIQFLKKYAIVPLKQNFESSPDAEVADHPSGKAIIAVNDPASLQAIDDLIHLLGFSEYQMVFSTRVSILSAINLSYDPNKDSAAQLVQTMEEDGSDILSDIEGAADLLDDTSEAPIIKLVNHIISQAIKARASDIHVEPYQNSFKVRYRVDGILYDLLTPPRWIQASLISRIKVMAKLNIAEKRLPQDGRIEVKMGNQDIDIRVSTVPTAFGERVVLRLLNKTTSLMTLPELGMLSDKLARLKKLVKTPNGIILVTGPTGSGKTTSLYAVLISIKTPDINIITIEDPVEYQIDGISQIQVNPKIDLTFAKGLRSIVRQDPDVVLVGEIRDRETAEIAVQSALTGHLVFSTLHTNDSASAITRLVDIGVEPFLISSSVVAVVAQRLIRVLCGVCKQPYEPEKSTLVTLGIDSDQLDGKVLYRAKGCPECFNTGFRGRLGIFEIMTLDDNLKSLILKSFDSNRIKTEALRAGMTTLRQDGIQKVLEGLTTIEEVLRVTQ